MIDINEYLSPKSTYVCPVCGVKIDNYRDCDTHIKTHSKPDKIISYSNKASDTNCPDCIIVKLSDGREAEYELLAVLDSKPEIIEEDDIEPSQVPAEPDTF